MKNLLFILLTFTLTMSSALAQEPKETQETEETQEEKKVATKMDAFVSKRGVFLKIIDYNRRDLKLTRGSAQTKIRKLYSGKEIAYFYSISKQGTYSTKIQSIYYEDLVAALIAIQSLKTEYESYNNLNPAHDYFENYFVSDDGFRVGYYLSKGKLNWYFEYTSGYTIYLKNIIDLESAFNNAKQKIEELQSL